MRPDGSVVELGGYDVRTGILYDPRGIIFPPVPAEPTIDDARAALALVKSLVREFPFVDASGLSVALSGILTAMVLRSLPTAPLHAFDAPTVGTGKSKLVDVASMFVSGHEAAVITPGKTEEELEKRLGSMLLAGDAVISFDNCSAPLGGDFLCACLTQPIVRARILGKSETPSLLSNAAMFGTGNNFSVFGDMVRRTLCGSLDAKCERPELRTFETEDPVKVLRRRRPPYVVAALTVLRAYVVAGSPHQTDALGSYEDWSDLVRSSLLWVGETDPCETMEKIRAEDQTLNTLATVINEWPFETTNRVTVKQIIERACEQTDDYAGSAQFTCAAFRDALLAGAGKGGMIDNVTLGNWIRDNKNRPIGRKRIIADGSRHGAICWRLETI
jgi:putative DNA primase/helicase